MSTVRVETGSVEQSIRGLRQEAQRLGHCAHALEREAAELEHTALSHRAQRLAEQLREQQRELEELCAALHDALRRWSEELEEQEEAPTEEPVEEAAEEQSEPASADYDGHEAVTLECSLLPEGEGQSAATALLKKYDGKLVQAFSGGIRFSEPVKALNPLTGEKRKISVAIPVYYFAGSYAFGNISDVSIEPGKTYRITGFWCSPADVYGQGEWVNDQLFGPSHSTQAGEWYQAYVNGPFCFAIADVAEAD